MHNTFCLAVIEIGLDKPTYSVMENVGDEDLGLMVCATVRIVSFDFTVLLIPHDDTAEGTVFLKYIGHGIST